MGGSTVLTASGIHVFLNPQASTWLTFYSHIKGVTGPNSVILYLTLSQVVL